MVAAIFGVSLSAALVLTPATRALALLTGAVTRPTPDRWCKQPTPLLGGVAIALATAAGLAMAMLLIGADWAASLGMTPVRPAVGVVVSAVFMCGVGLADDIFGLRPQAKFLLQLLAGVTLVSFGPVLP